MTYCNKGAEYFTQYERFSAPMARLLTRILDPNPYSRTSLSELKNELDSIDRFMMTREEIRFISGPSQAAGLGLGLGLGVSVPSLGQDSLSPPDSSLDTPLTSSRGPRIKLALKKNLKNLRFW